MKLLLVLFAAAFAAVHGQDEKTWKRKMLQNPKQCMSFMNQVGYGMTKCSKCRCSCSPPQTFCFQEIKKRNNPQTTCKNTPSQCVSAMQSSSGTAGTGGGGGGGGGGVRTTTRRPSRITTTRRPSRVTTTTRRPPVRTTTRASGGSSSGSCTTGAVPRGGARFFRGRCYASRSSCSRGCYKSLDACKQCNNLGGGSSRTTTRRPSSSSCPKGGRWRAFGSRCFKMSRTCSSCYADQNTCLRCKGN